MNKKTILILLLILASAFFVRYSLASSVNADTDESIPLLDAQLQLEGKSPLIRSPIFVGLLTPFATLDPSILNMRLLAVLLSTLTIIFVFLIGRELYSDEVGLVSAGLFAFTPFIAWYGSLNFTEPVSWFFISAALWIFLKAWKSGDLSLYFINGILLGVAFFVRQSAIVIVVAEIIFLLYIYRSAIFEFLKKSFVLGSGVLYTFALVLLTMNYSIVFDSKFYAYTGSYPLIIQKLGVTAWFLLEGLIMPIICLLFLFYLVKKEIPFDKSNKYILLLFALISIFYIISSKIHIHYFYEFAVVISLMGGVVLYNMWKIYGGNKNILVVLVLAGIFSMSIFSSYGGLEQYWTVEEAENVAGYLKSYTNESDKIFTASVIFPYLAGRDVAGDITHPFTYAIPGVTSEDYERWGYMDRGELIEYVIDADDIKYAVIDQNTYHCFFERNEELKVIGYAFYPEVQIGEIEIWRRLS